MVRLDDLPEELIRSIFLWGGLNGESRTWLQKPWRLEPNARSWSQINRSLRHICLSMRWEKLDIDTIRDVGELKVWLARVHRPEIYLRRTKSFSFRWHENDAHFWGRRTRLITPCQLAFRDRLEYRRFEWRRHFRYEEITSAQDREHVDRYIEERIEALRPAWSFYSGPDCDGPVPGLDCGRDVIEVLDAVLSECPSLRSLIWQSDLLTMPFSTHQVLLKHGGVPNVTIRNESRHWEPDFSMVPHGWSTLNLIIDKYGVVWKDWYGPLGLLRVPTRDWVYAVEHKDSADRVLGFDSEFFFGVRVLPSPSKRVSENGSVEDDDSCFVENWFARTSEKSRRIVLAAWMGHILLHNLSHKLQSRPVNEKPSMPLENWAPLGRVGLTSVDPLMLRTFIPIWLFGFEPFYVQEPEDPDEAPPALSVHIRAKAMDEIRSALLETVEPHRGFVKETIIISQKSPSNKDPYGLLKKDISARFLKASQRLLAKVTKREVLPSDEQGRFEDNLHNVGMWADSNSAYEWRHGTRLIEVVRVDAHVRQIASLLVDDDELRHAVAEAYLRVAVPQKWKFVK